MKRIMIILGLASAVTLTNCTKELPAGDTASTFTIKVNAGDTKTANDGMHTLWAEGDALSLLYAAAGTAPTSTFNTAKMSLTSGAGTSSGEFTGDAIISASTDFYVVYPYASALNIPGTRTTGYIYVGNRNGVTQNGYDSMNQLSGSSCPLYGKALGVTDGEIPSFTMMNLASVMELDITSACSTDFILTKVAVEASEDIVGSYYIDITGDTPVYTGSGSSYVSKIGMVTVTNGTAVSNGSTVKVYLPIKPYTQAAGTPLHITLTATVGGVSKSATIDVNGSTDASKRTFTAGKIKRVPVTVSSFASSTDKTVSQLSVGTTASVTGQVAAICTNGFVLADATGAVFVYKTVSGLSIGRNVTVSGTLSEYNSCIQFPNTSEVALGDEGSFTYPDAATLDAAAISTFVGRTSSALAQYVTFTGDVSGTRDFIVGDGSEANATGYYLTEALSEQITPCFNVTIKGYACFVTSGKCSVVVTEVVQNILKPVLPDLVFAQDGRYGGVGNYPVSDFEIQNFDDSWTVTITQDGVVFTNVSWYWDRYANAYLHYAIAQNDGAARTGWFKITLTKGKYSVERTYEYVQNANPSYVSEEQTYTWTLPSATLSKDGGSVKGGNVTWTYGTMTYVGFDSTKGVQIGSSNNPQSSWTISTSGIAGKIKSVKVNASMGSKGSSTLSISVGGVSYLSEQALTTTATDYTGTGTSSGEIAITLKASAKAMYIKSIEVVYQ